MQEISEVVVVDVKNVCSEIVGWLNKYFDLFLFEERIDDVE
jgi:hypothetical protein